MGSISGIIEGAYLLGGTVGPHVCLEDARNLVIKSTSGGYPIIHAGNDARIYHDNMCVPGEMGSNDSFQGVSLEHIITTGSGVIIEDNGQNNHIVATGYESEISYHYWLNLNEVSLDSRVMSENKTYMGDDKSKLMAGLVFAFQNSIIMSTGDQNSIFIDAGIDPDAKSKGNKVLASGEASNIQITDDSLAVTVGADSNVTVGDNSVILSSETSVTFSVGLGSCAAVVWHDGTRKRVKVVYEGENGILADTQYKIDQNGNVVAV